MLSAAEIAEMQAVATASLNTSCQIQRSTLTADGYGSSSETWTTVATVNVTLAQPSEGQLQKYAERIGGLASWLVRFPYGTDVRVNDQLIVGGVTLRVEAPLFPTSYEMSSRVLASEVR
jgi:head-tail adaptor